VRASRLVALLLLLQTRGRATASELAEALEVSVRTIYRDLEALSAAGVPVYAEPGRNGGCQLIDGYRTRLTGLTAKEAEALFMSGVPGPVGELGLGTVLGAAQLKLLAALPKDLADRASVTRQRFHLDAPSWFKTGRNEPHLATIAAAVWEDRCIVMRYRHPGSAEPVVRNVEPFGLVLKAGVWYLVARRDGEMRTYRVSRVDAVEASAETFERPVEFDLARYWSDAVAEFESSAPELEVTVIASESGFASLQRVARGHGRQVREHTKAGAGRLRCVVAFESFDDAYGDLLWLGAEVEVVEPQELRTRIAATANALHALYASAS
jgi:predicted DNA-binding transcriptional regulator YafY